jgi:hypothetical protein
MRSKDAGQLRTDLNAAVDEEAFEAFNAIRYQRSQMVLQLHLNIAIPSPCALLTAFPGITPPQNPTSVQH